MPSGTSRSRAYASKPSAPSRPCDVAGCTCAGDYRAPKSRQTLRVYWWLCLDHVREYNRAWDYYRGMSPAEIEEHVRTDTLWQRPTWPLGVLGTSARGETVVRDALHDLMNMRASTADRRAADKAPPELRDALQTFGLTWPTTIDAVKVRYKELAKHHHPDANGGSREAEEQLKTINVAYAALRTKLVTGPRSA